jgi:hypothetical protein
MGPEGSLLCLQEPLFPVLSQINLTSIFLKYILLIYVVLKFATYYVSPKIMWLIDL